MGIYTSPKAKQLLDSMISALNERRREHGDYPDKIILSVPDFLDLYNGSRNSAYIPVYDIEYYEAQTMGCVFNVYGVLTEYDRDQEEGTINLVTSYLKRVFPNQNKSTTAGVTFVKGSDVHLNYTAPKTEAR